MSNSKVITSQQKEIDSLYEVNLNIVTIVSDLHSIQGPKLPAIVIVPEVQELYGPRVK
jgi:hypothetical protein